MLIYYNRSINICNFLTNSIFKGCSTVVVGKSSNNSKTISMKNERICPGIVNKSNRIKLDYFNANDAWSVSQHGTQITVTRTDAKNAVWLLDLRFHCCDRGIVIL